MEKLEPLRFRKELMDSFAQAVAFLESLSLAHGDLRPENTLLNGNQLNFLILIAQQKSEQILKLAWAPTEECSIAMIWIKDKDDVGLPAF